MHRGGWRGVSAAALVAATLLSVYGCSGKKRPFATGDGYVAGGDGADQDMSSLLPGNGNGDAAGGSTDEDGPTGPVDLLPSGALGYACAIDSGCNLGFCVAGRCCDRRCDGVCEACSEGGHCELAPADDTRCPVIPCAEAAN